VPGSSTVLPASVSAKRGALDLPREANHILMNSTGETLCITDVFLTTTVNVLAICGPRLLLRLHTRTMATDPKATAHALEQIAVDEKLAAAGQHPPIDKEAEKRLLRKTDLHVVPILFFLFLLAFLDRTNIGTLKRAALYLEC
jgi:hypothetical protein